MRTHFFPTLLVSLTTGLLLGGLLGGCTSPGALAGVGTTPGAPAGAGTTAGTDGPVLAPEQDPAVLNGTYVRGPLTAADWWAAGMNKSDADDAAGTFTFQFQDSHVRMIGEPFSGETGETTVCTGSYTVDRDRVTVTLRHGRGCGPGGEFFSATFQRDMQELLFTDTQAAVTRHTILVEGSWGVADCSSSPTFWNCGSRLG
jgi:hypothetical protein